MQVYNKIMGKNTSNVFLFPDLSFYILKNFYNKTYYQKNNVKLKVGLTLVDWYNNGIEARANYIKSIKALIKYIFEKKKGEILIVPQVTLSTESINGLLDEIMSEFDSNEIKIINDELDIEELINIYKELDILVATRMHSAIFSICVGTPVLAIAYDHGGKWNILKMIGLNDFIIDFDKINEHLIIEKFEYILYNKDEIMSNIRRNLQTYFDEVENNIKVLKEIIEKKELRI